MCISATSRINAPLRHLRAPRLLLGGVHAAARTPHGTGSSYLNSHHADSRRSSTAAHRGHCGRLWRGATPSLALCGPQPVGGARSLTVSCAACSQRVYGAVDAPSWVAPVGGIAVIATALLPVLLAPGEEAFTRQQGDEEKVANQFGRDRRK